jgi:hypothetical protein
LFRKEGGCKYELEGVYLMVMPTMDLAIHVFFWISIKSGLAATTAKVIGYPFML